MCAVSTTKLGRFMVLVGRVLASCGDNTRKASYPRCLSITASHDSLHSTRIPQLVGERIVSCRPCMSVTVILDPSQKP